MTLPRLPSAKGIFLKVLELLGISKCPVRSSQGTHCALTPYQHHINPSWSHRDINYREYWSN